MAAANSIQFVLTSLTFLTTGMTVAFPGVVLPALENSATKLSLLAALVVGTLYTASFLGILAGSTVENKWGRRKCLLISSVQSIVGWLMIGMNESHAATLVGTIFIGAGAGFSSSCTTLHLAEIATRRWESYVSIAKNGCFFFGITLTYGLGYVFRNNWQKISMISSVTPTVNFVLGILFLKESTRWIQQHENQEVGRSQNDMWKWRTYKQFRIEVLERKDVCKPFYMINAINVLRQLSGAFVVNTYAISVATKVVNGVDPYGSALAIVVSNLIGALSANAISKRYGVRRTLTYFGSIMGLATLILSKLHEISGIRILDLPAWLGETSLIVITVASTVFGVITQDLQEDMFPVDVRRICSLISTCTATLASCLAVVAYPTVETCWGFNNFLTLSASAGVACAVITIAMFPNTSDNAIEKTREVCEETETAEEDQKHQVLIRPQPTNKSEGFVDAGGEDLDKITVDPITK